MKLVTNEPLQQSGSAAAYLANKRRVQHLRSNRLAIAEPLTGRVKAQAAHASAGTFEANVLDLSLHGVRLAIPPQHSCTLLLGDVVEALTIKCDGQVIYRGHGIVTRALDRESHFEVGIELQNAAVDLDSVHRASARQSALHRWERELATLRAQRASAPFCAWVTELASFLETAKAFLDREELEMESLDMATRQAVSDELLAATAPDVITRMNRAGLELGGLVSDLPKGDHATYRAFLQMQLAKYFAASPFLARAKRKPLGYAGDYEMMNMLYRDHREGATLFGKALNLYATQQPVAQANINRIEYLGNKIRGAAASTVGRRTRVVSIGCGPAREILALLTNHPELGKRLDITLIDQEERAIAHCERTLAAIAATTDARVRVIRESARHLLTDRKLADSFGTCDLVYSAGLFDYLAGRSFGALLTTLYAALAERGSLVVGNVASSNPDRWAMEYFTEWFLYHRSPADLRLEAQALTPRPACVEVESEPLGVNLFLVVTR